MDESGLSGHDQQQLPVVSSSAHAYAHVQLPLCPAKLSMDDTDAINIVSPLQSLLHCYESQTVDCMGQRSKWVWTFAVGPCQNPAAPPAFVGNYWLSQQHNYVPINLGWAVVTPAAAQTTLLGSCHSPPLITLR